jgi:hypothetical protein
VRAIGLAELAQDDDMGRAIADAVVKDELQHVVLFGDPQQAGPDERGPFELERL